MIRRALGETVVPLQRAAMLPVLVEVMLAVGDLEEARRAADELDEIAGSGRRAMLEAMAAGARGSVELAEDRAEAALKALRRACRLWQELDAPYEVARVRVLVGHACRALGDEESAGMELGAAREAFERLAAAPDLARVDALEGRTPAGDHGLSTRELEVLRLVAAGKTNREIAAALVVSEHTVARHLQNIFGKLGVSSRTAATAFAFQHELV
jgi:ATP/maltotriose-dependent transcriptional regulator MalT